jgi:hypothetical protein
MCIANAGGELEILMKLQNVTTSRPAVMNRTLKALVTALFVVLIPCSSSFSQMVSGRIVSSVYSWKQFDSVDVSNRYARGFLSTIIDVSEGDFSLHTNLQGAATAREKVIEDKEVRTYSLYASWKNIFDVVDLSVGRMPFFAGVGNGTLDGLRLGHYFSDNTMKITVYGGANVPVDLTLSDWRPLAKNFTFGGQFVTSAISHTRLGVSFISRARELEAYQALRADSLFNPIEVTVTPDPRKEQLGSLDLSYRIGLVSAYGRYDYDIIDKSTRRGQVDVQLGITDDIQLSGSYIHRAPIIPLNSFFSVFTVHTTDEVEGGVDVLLLPRLRTYVRGAYVRYEGDKSFRYTVGIANDYANLSYRGNSGYAGELNSVSCQGLYPLFDRFLTPTIGLSYYSYRLSAAAAREEAITGLLGATVRPDLPVSFDVQVQWLRNAVYNNDVRIFAQLNYWFSERL